MYQRIKVPADERVIVSQGFFLNAPNNLIISYIEGDGTGFDIAPMMVKVVDATIKKAYKDGCKIPQMEIYTGEKSAKAYDPGVWLPEEAL